MQGIVKQFLCICDLHDVTLVDNADTVGDKADNRQVMGNKQVSDVTLTLELLHQVQNLCTNGNVQCGDGLVSDNQLGLHNHCTGNTDSLTLTAREFVGVTGQMLGQQTNIIDDLLNLCNAVCLIFEQLKVVQAFGDDVVNGSTLVQGCGRILEDHLDVTDDLTVQGLAGLTGNANALVLDLAGSTGVNADNSTADGSLTGAGLAYQREGLAFVNIKGGVLNSSNGIIALTESDVHILQAQQNFSAVLVQGTMLGQMGYILTQNAYLLL